jgi:hypothetical protein
MQPQPPLENRAPQRTLLFRPLNALNRHLVCTIVLTTVATRPVADGRVVYRGRFFAKATGDDISPTYGQKILDRRSQLISKARPARPRSSPIRNRHALHIEARKLAM